jgi:hypothetical protein
MRQRLRRGQMRTPQRSAGRQRLQRFRASDAAAQAQVPAAGPPRSLLPSRPVAADRATSRQLWGSRLCRRRTGVGQDPAAAHALHGSRPVVPYMRPGRSRGAPLARAAGRAPLQQSTVATWQEACARAAPSQQHEQFQRQRAGIPRVQRAHDGARGETRSSRVRRHAQLQPTAVAWSGRLCDFAFSG